MTERRYVVSREGNGWVYTVGGYRSGLFGSAVIAATIARTAAERAHRRGDDTQVELALGAERRPLWRKAPAH